MVCVFRLQIYDPQSDTWTLGAPMPEELDHSASVVFENKIWSTSGRWTLFFAHIVPALSLDYAVGPVLQ